MLALHLKQGDPDARRLASLYLRHQGAEALRRGPWGPVEAILTLAGVAVPLARLELARLRRTLGDKTGVWAKRPTARQ